MRLTNPNPNPTPEPNPSPDPQPDPNPSPDPQPDPNPGPDPKPDAEPKQVQLAMLEEEVQAANLKLSSKDLELELILEESTAREEQTQG